MNPDLSYTTTGREGESSARTANGMGENTNAIREQIFRLAAPTSNYSIQWGYSDSRSPRDKPKQALIALICCGQYMAVSMPGHGDLTALMS